MRDPREKGRLAEAAAKGYLQNLGYRILGMNLRLPMGEIDILAETDEALVLVEVKAGNLAEPFHPRLHFNKDKRRKYASLAAVYLSDRSYGNKDVRVDLVCVSGDYSRCEHYENALAM